ncbi:MAG: uroporphyrinogen-III C-methyltransferase [Arachnia sp.]
MAETSTTPGRVILVGGGPGDPDLLTIGGLKALRAADVVLYDHLAPAASLTETRPDAELIDVGKLPGGRRTPQAEINALLIDHARQGRTVVRFKGGDPFVFGRGGEEWQACAAAGITVEVIPGVTSSIAGPGLAGIPVTHRGLAQSFTVISGHVGPEHPDSTTNWDAVAASNGTVVLLMAVATLEAICARLIAAGMPPDTPAASIADAASDHTRIVRATLATIAARAAAAQLAPPAITVIGAVAGLTLPEAP